MRERKVWKLFNLLRNTEKEDFKHWLHYALGDKQQFVQRLYACMLDHPHLKGSQEELWKYLYKEQVYDDARFRKLCRDLSRHLEYYLSLQVFKESLAKQEIALLQAFNQREAPDLFIKSSKNLKRKSARVQGQDATYFRYLYDIEVEIQRFITKFLRDPKEREKLFPDQYQHMLTYFDTWWAEEKLQLALGKVQLKRNNASFPQELLLDELLEKLQGEVQWQENKRLQVYVRVFKLLMGEKDDIGSLIDLIRKTEEQWTEEELRNFLTSLINAYIRKLNEKGEKDTAQELFSLFEWGIEARLFFIDQNLPEIVYKNLINICLKVAYYDQAKKYLEELKELLPESRQEECYRFNLGRYYFFTQSYKELIGCLAGQPFSNVFDEVDARTYLLQAQYEIASEEPEWIARQLNTLTRFVKYQKLPGHGKTAMINGFKVFKKLVLAYSASDYEQVKKLIQETRPLFRAAWLLEKAEEKIGQTIKKG